VAISIPLTSTTDLYTDAGAAVFDFGGTPYAAGYLFVQNAGVYLSLKTANAQGSATWGPEFATNTALVPLAGGTASLARPNGPDRIYGVRARSLLAGTPAVVYGGVFQEGEAAVLPSNQIGGTITTTGKITNPTTLNGIIARINSDGTIDAGNNFTCSRTSLGQYQIVFTAGFFSVSPNVTVGSNSLNNVGVSTSFPTVNGFSVTAFNISTGAPQDVRFSFDAIVPQ